MVLRRIGTAVLSQKEALWVDVFSPASADSNCENRRLFELAVMKDRTLPGFRECESPFCETSGYYRSYSGTLLGF